MSTQHTIHTTFPGRLIFIGFGSIGQGVLPLILRHVGGLTPDRITIVTADDAGRARRRNTASASSSSRWSARTSAQILEPLVGRGDFVLNVSVDVSSIALIEFCWERGALYLDTCIEPWPGGYTDPSLSPSRRSNYALREEALALRKLKDKDSTPKPTAVLTHGANPGLVQHFVKQALLNLAADLKVDARRPADPRGLGGAGADARRQGGPHRRARHAGAGHAEADRGSSSTPGRSRDSSAKGRSRPSSAGARTSEISRATAASTTSAAAARST